MKMPGENVILISVILVSVIANVATVVENDNQEKDQDVFINNAQLEHYQVDGGDIEDDSVGQIENSEKGIIVDNYEIDYNSETDGNLETEHINPKFVDTGRRKVIGAPFILLPPVPVVAMIGDNVSLTCLTEGDPAPKVIWHSKRAGKLAKVGHNYKIDKNGTLDFWKVEKQDEAEYRCKAKNPHGSVSSDFVRLFVEAAAEIVEFPESVRVTAGTNLDLQCAATGDPPPLISWLKDGRQIVEGVEFKPFSHYSRSVLRLNATVTANYTCHAMNQLINNMTMDTRSFMIYAERLEGGGKAEEKKDNNRGYCAPYNGAVCRSHLHGRGMVWYNISQDNAGGWLNEEITMGIQKELLNTMEEPCRSAAEALLCRYAFPTCVIHSGVAVPLLLCHEDCVAVRNQFCYSAWSLIESQKKKGIYFKSRGHFRLPTCEKLPRYNNQNGSCTKSGITDMRWDLATTDCVKGNGRYYQGTVNQTRGGLQCQPWYTSHPHSHNSPPAVFPEMANSSNFCRNGGGGEHTPWCYTMDPLVRWQHCDIEQCENMTDANFAIISVDTVDIIETENTIISIEELMSPTFIILAAATLIVMAM